jgi:hypothetical protein
MAGKGQFNLIGWDTTPIVLDTNLAQATTPYFDQNPPRPGIESIFQQLLYNRGWSFNDFAGGDLRGNGFIKQTNGHTALSGVL